MAGIESVLQELRVFDPPESFVKQANIAGMDAFARGLKIAAKIRADGRIDEFVRNRYRSWDSGIGAKIESGKATFADCEKHALKLGEVTDLESGRQELLEAIYNEFI